MGPVLAVVGAGPRGLSVLERLAAHLEAADPLSGALREVHVVDPFGPGGRIWRWNQSDELLMNTVAADATLYLDDTVESEGPIHAGATLLEWSRRAKELRTEGWLDARLASDAASLNPTTPVSRRLYGAYLAWVTHEVATRLRQHGVLVEFHSALARSIHSRDDGELIELEDGTTIAAGAVVLALGHDENEADSEEARALENSMAGGWTYSPPASPIDAGWEGIPASDDVIVRGLGLNFFDVMALLTIERGGTFVEARPGGLEYRPAGREPVLWVGSRRGVPFKAKPRLDWPRKPQPRRYPSDEVIRRFSRPFNFYRDGWPWVRKEALWQYYRAQTTLDQEKELAWLFDSAPGSAVPSAATIGSRFPGVVHDYVPEQTGDPFAETTFTTQSDAEAAILDWIRQDLSQALEGQASPVKAADAAIGASRAWLSPLSDFDGFDAASYQRFRGWFGPYANSLAGGPPLIRTQQLLALAEAGVVRFLPPGIIVTTDHDGVTVTSDAVPGWNMTARALIEARLHAPSIKRSLNSLIRSLCSEGRARSFTVPGNPSLDTDGIEVTPKTFNTVDSAGRANERIFALGIPLGTHVGTSFTAFGRSNSLFLRESDAVARAALAVLDQDARAADPVAHVPLMTTFSVHS
ncbi:hypothetical protein J2T11_000059 [Paenarthrobacter nicotinovorans]|uniref:FAD/NAD(P)-binding protein n=1 Tax=Paenarthrobacter nicotinovorans TaxID=29320 RepID=UPI00277DADF3|nr:FAD/NAD(P)-binding protein [Paenarthrobacter nicotinovorans]MDP9933735.1 hypothetical protein [Paenarthrobacter nicotinovorans]